MYGAGSASGPSEGLPSSKEAGDNSNQNWGVVGEQGQQETHSNIRNGEGAG